MISRRNLEPAEAECKEADTAADTNKGAVQARARTEQWFDGPEGPVSLT